MSTYAIGAANFFADDIAGGFEFFATLTAKANHLIHVKPAIVTKRNEVTIISNIVVDSAFIN